PPPSAPLFPYTTLFRSVLVDLFLQDLPGQVAAVRAAIHGCDPIALDRAAHTLKGAVANFHAGPTVEAARRLEMMGRENRLAGAEDRKSTRLNSSHVSIS